MGKTRQTKHSAGSHSSKMNRTKTSLVDGYAKNTSKPMHENSLCGVCGVLGAISKVKKRDLTGFVHTKVCYKRECKEAA